MNKTFIRVVRESVTLVLAVVVITVAAHSQGSEPQDPKRGMQPGAPLSISDIENINLANGNLSLNMPLVNLPKGRGPGGWIGYVYNSKLYKPIGEEILVGIEMTDQNVLYPSDDGGWRETNSLNYQLKLTNRLAGLDPIPCTSATVLDYQKNVYKWKLEVIMPDGANIEFRPVGYTDHYGDGYFNIDSYGNAGSTTAYPTCSGGVAQVTTAPITYYSADGSRLRLVVTPSTQAFVLYFPDGSFFQSSLGRMTDRYGSYVQGTGAFTYGGKPASGIVDNMGRKIFTTPDDDEEDDDGTFIYQLGVGGEEIKWAVRMKDMYVRREYETTARAGTSRGGTSTLPLEAEFRVIDEIVLPAQLGGQSYQFTYTGSDSSLGSGYSAGWGEISSITWPSGAEVEYGFTHTLENTDRVLQGFVASKTLTYDAEYDGSSPEVNETWTYAFNNNTATTTVTSPDGSQMKQTRFDISGEPPYPLNGSVKTVENPNGTKVERIWATNSTPWGGANPWVKMEFTSIKNASGSYAFTSIREFEQDKNGNTTKVKEYDFIPYNDPSITRVNGEVTAFNPGVPPARTTITSYHNAVPNSLDTTTDAPYGYWNFGGIKGVAASTEIRNASDQTAARTEFYYDDPSSTANLEETRVWDSIKGSVSNPLTTGGTGNSISTFAEYDQFGNVTKMIDAKQVETTFTYGCIDGTTSTPCPANAPGGLYPTKTEVASNHASLKRTSTAIYDYHTGVVTSTTDADNAVTNAVEYDRFGRPTKAITAQGSTGFESWTVTDYHDAERYIVVRSDLEAKGDGRKVAIQYFDQLGRVRLTRTLEDAATQEADDPCLTDETECEGIKVQTRYKFAAGYTYQLTSNPYRAATSGAETADTMGWTLSTAWASGRRSEVQTFVGAGLPAAFGGSNANSTGIVRTDIDADRTLVTDQAGKSRISKTNALGQLKEVWEILAASETGSESVAFPGTSIAHGFKTNYSYDTLNNLITVNQGSQQRDFTYSSLSRLLTATNPESGTISYGYDPNGNLFSKTDARGVKTDFVYDALNRVTSRNYSTPGGTPANYQATPNVTYTYGTTAPAIGKLTKVTNGTGADSSTTEYTEFDILGRVKAHKQTTDGTDHTTDYTYDLSGALIEQTYPSGRKVQNVLDTNGDLEMVKSRKNANSGYWAYANNFTYNAAGAVTSMQLGNGAWESTAFNSRLQPTQIALGTVQNGYDKLKLNYTYGSTTNNNGNVLTQTITVPTAGASTGFTAVQSYNYDSLDRLKDATENITPYGGSQTQSWKQVFTFDRYGNRNFDEANTTTLPKNCGSSPSFTVCTSDRKKFNPSIQTTNNRLVLDQDNDSTADYAFDTSGNTTTDAQGRTFVYDAENKQVEVKNSASQTVGQYFYDGDGKRVKKFVPATGETTIFVYDAAGKLVAEYSTIVEPIETAKVAYLTSDHLGSPRINTDKNGNVTARHDYHPFGEEIATSQRTDGLGYVDDTVRKQFTGYERDIESDLDFAQARMYNFQHGRFTSIDSVGPDLKNPQTLNKYQYCLNNPLRYIDKTGKYEEDVHRDLTNLLAYAAGFSSSQSARIASANQGVDDNPFTSPFRSAKAREDFHFTSQERRDQMWSAFEGNASFRSNENKALDSLGQFFHAQQDSFSHDGYGIWFGHTKAGHSADKTYNDPEKAERMAKDTFDRMVSARNLMAKNDGTLYRPVSFNAIKGLIGKWVRETDSTKKQELGEQIRQKIQNGRDIQKDNSTPRKTIRMKPMRVRGEEE